LADKVKHIGKTLLKFLVSGGAMYFVFQHIDWDSTKKIIGSAQTGLLGLATFFFTGSKVVSAYRLQIFFRNAELKLRARYNLRLYWVGMFYNLFLPGGIGGDGYKVYLLNKRFKVAIKPLIQAALLDRISGLMALVFLAGAGFFFLDQRFFPSWLPWLVGSGMFLMIPVYSYVVARLFPRFHPSFWTTNLHSLTVQLMQLICAYFILLAISAEGDVLAYQVLFLISSVVAVFPFTIGGVGARELTFIFGYQYLGIDENASIAFTLIFFLITAAVSAVGGFIRVKAKDSDRL
jgi:hypothetical protein